MVSDITLSNFSVGVISVSVVGIALGIAWLCAKVTNIEQFITTPIAENRTVSDALAGLKEDNVKSADLAKEAVRVDKLTSDQVNVTAELGHQSAARARKVASNLSGTHRRADAETTGVPGAAADAGLKSDPKDIKE